MFFKLSLLRKRLCGICSYDVHVNVSFRGGLQLLSMYISISTLHTGDCQLWLPLVVALCYGYSKGMFYSKGVYMSANKEKVQLEFPLKTFMVLLMGLM
jgi:hypothetical protein